LVVFKNDIAIAVKKKNDIAIGYLEQNMCTLLSELLQLDNNNDTYDYERHYVCL
jgi:hypothetical protein